MISTYRWIGQIEWTDRSLKGKNNNSKDSNRKQYSIYKMFQGSGQEMNIKLRRRQDQIICKKRGIIR